MPPPPPARGQRRRVVPARLSLELREAAVRVPDDEGGNPRGAGEDVRGGGDDRGHGLGRISLATVVACPPRRPGLFALLHGQPAPDRPPRSKELPMPRRFHPASRSTACPPHPDTALGLRLWRLAGQRV